MKKYAKVINEETKEVSIGTGTNSAFYQSIGMSEMEVEQAYDGSWYVKGFAPEKPVEELQAQVRAVRNQYLKQTDEFMIVDYPISDEERVLYRQYRTYLRDYTLTENWWESEPLKFEEWNNPAISAVEVSHL